MSARETNNLVTRSHALREVRLTIYPTEKRCKQELMLMPFRRDY